MKALLQSKSVKICLFFFFITNSFVSQAQDELIFQNSVLSSGTAGANNAVYKFPLVNDTTDALVKIVGRSSNLVTLYKLDISNEGFNKAFQPQVSYNNGSTNTAANWWMEFEISFVKKNTNTPASISKIYASSLDIDGDNNSLRENLSFYGAKNYTVENNTGLQVSSVTGTINNPQQSGKNFNGVLTEYPGIDTTKTNVMVTNLYEDVNVITIRIGGSTTGSANDTRRKASIWFKAFPYTNPVTTLPVTLSSFIATLNSNSVNIKWTTASEMNVSHFVLERSIDGTNFSEAGLVFAKGNSNTEINYELSNNISSLATDIIYYRLRIVDIDGKLQYSVVRIVRVSKTGSQAFNLTVYPNPVASDLRITIPESWQNKPVVYNIYTINGTLVASKSTNNSSQTEVLNMNKLTTGLYLIKVICNGQTVSQKIVKQ
jgi:hypothetical protein